MKHILAGVILSVLNIQALAEPRDLPMDFYDADKQLHVVIADETFEYGHVIFGALYNRDYPRNRNFSIIEEMERPCINFKRQAYEERGKIGSFVKTISRIENLDGYENLYGKASFRRNEADGESYVRYVRSIEDFVVIRVFKVEGPTIYGYMSSLEKLDGNGRAYKMEGYFKAINCFE